MAGREPPGRVGSGGHRLTGGLDRHLEHDVTDERPAGEPPPEEVGADTEKFRAFVRDSEQRERQEQPNNAFRVLSLAIGLLVLGAVVALLLR